MTMRVIELQTAILPANDIQLAIHPDANFISSKLTKKLIGNEAVENMLEDEPISLFYTTYESGEPTDEATLVCVEQDGQDIDLGSTYDSKQVLHNNTFLVNTRVFHIAVLQETSEVPS